MRLTSEEEEVRRLTQTESERQKQATQTDKSLISDRGEGFSSMHTKREQAFQTRTPTLTYGYQSTAFNFGERKKHFHSE